MVKYGYICWNCKDHFYLEENKEPLSANSVFYYCSETCYEYSELQTSKFLFKGMADLDEYMN